MLKSQHTSYEESPFLLYKYIRQLLRMPVKIKIYFDLLQHSLTQTIDQKMIRNKQGFSTQFIRAFLKLSKKEKQQIILANISSLYLNNYKHETIDAIQQQQQQTKDTLQKRLPSFDKIYNCESKCQIKIYILNLPYWKQTNFNLQTSKKTVLINYNNIKIDLRTFLIRKSKVHENTLVLEAASIKVPRSQQKICLHIKQKEQYQQVFTSIFNTIMVHRNNQLNEQYKKSIEEIKNEIFPQNSGIQISIRPLLFLGEKSINDYLIQKKTIYSYLQKVNNTFFPIHKRNSCIIQKSYSDQTFFRLQNIFKSSKDDIKRRLFQNLDKYSYISKNDILQTFSNKYQAVYQKYYIKGKKIDQIILQEVNLNDYNQNGQILVVKHVDSIINKSFMEFCTFTLSKVGQNSCKLVIVGCFNTLLLGGTQNLIALLQEYVNIIMGEFTNSHILNNSIVSKEQYYTILDELSIDAFNQIQNIQSTQLIKQRFIPQSAIKPKEVLIPYTSIKQIPSKGDLLTKYIFHKYLVWPQAKHKVQQKIQTINWLVEEWKRTKGGGLVCKNQTVIQNQRKVYKKLLVAFGEQIIKTKGILNLSLPVIIFKKQSQLTSMAKTFKMVPYFMQKACSSADALQRFKWCISTMVSINALNLSFEKPFNPILGQTLQVYINGCPLYIEQISHHPPITTYYFVGRGYKLYGSAHIKIDIGLNNAKGYSELHHTIEFQNGDKVEYLFPKLCIGGLLFGERTFNFEGKVYMYDLTNNYVADLFFGQVKKTFFASESHPEDQVSGKIYQASNSFAKQYLDNRPTITIEPKHTQKQLQTISGIWNQSLKFNNKSYTQFVGSNIDPTYVMQDDEYVLLSDSRFRMDLKHLCDGDVDKAQQAKVQMEQSQRKDKKLRIQYGQKSK